MNQMFDDLIRAVEEMIRLALIVPTAITPTEIKVREKMARQVLDAWATGARLSVSTDFSANFDSEYDRLEELIVELSLALPAAL